MVKVVQNSQNLGSITQHSLSAALLLIYALINIDRFSNGGPLSMNLTMTIDKNTSGGDP